MSIHPDPYTAMREALEPIIAFTSLPSFAKLPNDFIVTKGSQLAARQLTAGDLRRVLSCLSTHTAAGARPVGEAATPEDRAEQYIQAAIDRAPEPLRRLGEWLANKLDEDDWKTAERMLLGAAIAHPAEESGEVERLTRDVDFWKGCFPSDGSCIRCGSVPRNADGLCATCVDEGMPLQTEVDPEWVARASVSIAQMVNEWHFACSAPTHIPADLIARRLERFVPAAEAALTETLESKARLVETLTTVADKAQRVVKIIKVNLGRQDEKIKDAQSFAYEIERDARATLASEADVQGRAEGSDALAEMRERSGKLDRIRAAGWAVAVHNDYRLNGEAHTFYLLTKNGRAVKGEGLTDDDALACVLAEIAALSTQESSAALAGDAKEAGR